MQLVPTGNEWWEGEGAERAVVAYTRNADGRVVYPGGTEAAQPKGKLISFQHALSSLKTRVSEHGVPPLPLSARKSDGDTGLS